jgi:hypothetical protein
LLSKMPCNSSGINAYDTGHGDLLYHTLPLFPQSFPSVL